MGKGGPLAFLNKKPWHPSNFRNQEDIWKREQAYLAELAKRDELKKQIEEEREREDNVTQFQREKLGEQRVEWMYQGGFAAREDAEKKKEQFLLGKAVDKLPSNDHDEGQARVDEIAAGSSVAPPSGIKFSDNETWSRLNADPMLTMKRVELDRTKQIRENLKVAKLQAQLRMKAAESLRSSQGKEKKSKKEKKDKKSKHKRKLKDDDRSSREETGSPAPGSPIIRQANSGAERPQLEREATERGGYGSQARGRSHHDRSRSPCDYTAREDRHMGEKRKFEHHRTYTDDEYRKSRRQHYSTGDESRRMRGDRDNRSCSPVRGNERWSGRHSVDESYHRRRARVGRDDNARARSAGVRRDGGHRGDRDGSRSYGLQDGHMPEYARRDERDDTALTKRALETRAAEREAQAAEESERAAIARRRHRVGGLSAEEKEARRRDMMANAAQVDELRMGILRRNHDADAELTIRESRDTEDYMKSEERRLVLASGAAKC